MAKDKPKKKPGPQEERLSLPGEWKDRLKEALGKQKPEGGWPDPNRDYVPEETEPTDEDSGAK